MPKQQGAAKNWHFCYNNYVEEDIQKAIDYFNRIGAEFVFQKEFESTKHLQGHVEFKERRRFTKTKNDLKGEGLARYNWHWEVTISPDHDIKYCSDPDKRDGGDDALYTNMSEEKIQAAIDRCDSGAGRGRTGLQRGRKRKHSDELAIPQFTAEELRIPERSALYKWQRDALEEAEGVPSDRVVKFFVDQEGAAGKTVLCKYLVYHHGAVLIAGKTNDISDHIRRTMATTGAAPKIILIDIPRCSSAYINYQGIEAAKNGLMFCGKYESGQIMFPSPHVFVFTNQWPDEGKLSHDRYVIVDIKQDPEWNSLPGLAVPEEYAPPVFDSDGELVEEAVLAYLMQ